MTTPAVPLSGLALQSLEAGRGLACILLTCQIHDAVGKPLIFLSLPRVLLLDSCCFTVFPARTHQVYTNEGLARTEKLLFGIAFPNWILPQRLHCCPCGTERNSLD
ncbi:hypothetical protein MHYP_G00086420 [Metynnis hypsauchen]